MLSFENILLKHKEDIGHDYWKLALLDMLAYVYSTNY